MTAARSRPYTTVRAARFVQRGRSDYTVTRRGGNRARELDRMPTEKSEARDLRWCVAIAFVLPFVLAALSNWRWS